MKYIKLYESFEEDKKNDLIYQIKSYIELLNLKHDEYDDENASIDVTGPKINFEDKEYTLRWFGFFEDTSDKITLQIAFTTIVSEHNYSGELRDVTRYIYFTFDGHEGHYSDIVREFSIARLNIADLIKIRDFIRDFVLTRE